MCERWLHIVLFVKYHYKIYGDVVRVERLSKVV